MKKAINIVLNLFICVFIYPVGIYAIPTQVELSDCDSLGTPTSDECTKLCNSIGFSGTYHWNSWLGAQRCRAEVQNYNITTPDPIWIPDEISTQLSGNCGDNQPKESSVSLSIKKSNSLTVTGSFSSSLQATINTAINGLGSVTAEANSGFICGLSKSWEKEITHSYSEKISVPGCGAKRTLLGVFYQEVQCTANVLLYLDGCCTILYTTSEWVNVKSGQSHVTGTSKAYVASSNTCQVACTGLPNDVCTDSSTIDVNPCDLPAP